MGALLGLIPLIGQVLPMLTGLLGTPLQGSILGKAADIADRVFGTHDPSQIQLQIAQDQTKLEAFKAQLAADTQEEVNFFQDIQNARNQTIALAQAQSPIAWGAPIMTILITMGFFVILAIFVAKALNLSEFQQAVLNVMVGYLGASFQQCVNYWLGTTRSSGNKDTVLASLATTALSKAGKRQQ
jgi:hypothetical protein